MGNILAVDIFLLILIWVCAVSNNPRFMREMCQLFTPVEKENMISQEIVVKNLTGTVLACTKTDEGGYKTAIAFDLGYKNNVQLVEIPAGAYADGTSISPGMPVVFCNPMRVELDESGTTIASVRSYKAP